MFDFKIQLREKLTEGMKKGIPPLESSFEFIKKMSTNYHATQKFDP